MEQNVLKNICISIIGGYCLNNICKYIKSMYLLEIKNMNNEESKKNTDNVTDKINNMDINVNVDNMIDVNNTSKYKNLTSDEIQKLYQYLINENIINENKKNYNEYHKKNI